MAFPTIRNAATIQNSTSLGAGFSVTMPTHVTGDLILIFVAHDTATVTSTFSSVFTSTLNSSSLSCFGKIAASAGETATVTGTANDYVILALSVQAHGATSLGNVLAGTVATSASGNADPPSLATGTTRDWLWFSCCAVDLTTGNSISAVPANYTQLSITKSANSTSSVGLGVGWQALGGATEDPGTFSNTSRAWVAETIAVPSARQAKQAGSLQAVKRASFI
jgi:hypothetical protein